MFETSYATSKFNYLTSPDQILSIYNVTINMYFPILKHLIYETKRQLMRILKHIIK